MVSQSMTPLLQAKSLLFVVATRLTQIAHCRILLIEAGGEGNLTWIFLLWQNCCFSMENGQYLYLYEKVMGGSRTISYMIYEYTRGNRKSCNMWPLAGNWEPWLEVLRSCRAILFKDENTNNTELKCGNVHHTTYREVTFSYTSYRSY
jgi:hypothetical protein